MPTPNLVLHVTPATNVYNVAPALTAQEASALLAFAVVLLVFGILLIEGGSIRALYRSVRGVFLVAGRDKSLVTRGV